jgi:hypothetical protein
MPEIRRDMMRWLADQAPILWAALPSTAFLVPPRLQRTRWEDTATALAMWRRGNLRRSELCLVDGPMTALARHAGEAMPDYRLHPDDVPFETGLLIWSAPAVTLAASPTVRVDGLAIIAASWAVQTDCVAVDWWADAYQLIRDHPTLHDRAAARAAVGRLAHERESMLPYGEAAAIRTLARDNADFAPAVLTLLATWLLMGQTIASVQTTPPNRSDMRRMRRDDIEPSPVQVVTLRRPDRPRSESDPGGGGREYRHQWIVRGHWRRQWYPSRQDHRPVWIAPHLAGPEDAPLLRRDAVVNVLRR